MVGAGALIVKRFHAVLLLFALILLYQGLKITFVGEEDDDDDDLEDNKIIKAGEIRINAEIAQQLFAAL